jgi:hypothetical protein
MLKVESGDCRIPASKFQGMIFFEYVAFCVMCHSSEFIREV